MAGADVPLSAHQPLSLSLWLSHRTYNISFSFYLFVFCVSLILPNASSSTRLSIGMVSVCIYSGYDLAKYNFAAFAKCFVYVYFMLCVTMATQYTGARMLFNLKKWFFCWCPVSEGAAKRRCSHVWRTENAKKGLSISRTRVRDFALFFFFFLYSCVSIWPFEVCVSGSDTNLTWLVLCERQQTRVHFLYRIDTGPTKCTD